VSIVKLLAGREAHVFNQLVGLGREANSHMTRYKPKDLEFDIDYVAEVFLHVLEHFADSVTDHVFL
jgi:hypothetical protein